MKKLFKCTVCNYLHEGTEAPDRCPKCGAPKEKFKELTAEEMEKVYQSDPTNDLLMRFISTAADLFLVCDKGIEFKLDPACVKFFKQAKDELWKLKQNAKAEIANHLVKKKW